MAFSYSDKNFTVVGNLCFVHIILDADTGRFIDIPPAIGERILCSNIVCTYPYISSKGASGSVTIEHNIGYARINKSKSKISLSSLGEGYLSFYFPIDSNK